MTTIIGKRYVKKYTMDDNGGGYGCTIICLIVISIFIIFLFVTICRHKKNRCIDNSYGSPEATNDNDDALLQKLWRGKGILNTSMTLQQACPGYFGEPGAVNCPASLADCLGGVVNIGDYGTLNNIIATADNSISCFALATSLQSSRLAQIVFGPFITGFGKYNQSNKITGDTTVGIFLDIVPLQQYIGCMSLLDSASVERYGNTDVRIPHALQITSEKLSKDYQGVLDQCAASDECGFFMAGCGGSQGANPGASQRGKGYNFVEEPFKIPTYTGPEGGPWIPKGWTNVDYKNGTPGTIPFFPGTDKGLAAFEETLIQTQNIVGLQSNPQEWQGSDTHCWGTVLMNFSTPPTKPSFQNSCSDHWSYQFLNPNNYANGYRENEVDIFVPQTTEATLYGPDMRCVPDEGFVRAFRDAVVGVYATKYCAKDVKFQDRDASMCCNLETSKIIALAMAEQYNATPGVPRKINAWVWDVVDPTGRWTAPVDPREGRLAVTKIKPQHLHPYYTS